MSENNKSSFVNDRLVPFFGKIAGSRHLIALRDGMTLAVPMIIIGSVFMIIAQFPIKGYQTFGEYLWFELGNDRSISNQRVVPYYGTDCGHRDFL